MLCSQKMVHSVVTPMTSMNLSVNSISEIKGPFPLPLST